MFIRNCWYVAGWSRDLPAEGMITRTLLNEPLVLFRTGRGDVVALEDRCCHRQAPLSLGRREGDDIRCLYHGLKFDPSGRCIEIPGQETIPARARVRRYPAVDRHSWLWVWMGEEGGADESLIPPVVGLDDPVWAMRPGALECQANHMLIHDNLCDLSHFAYVHAGSFAGGADHMARSHPKITTLERGIRVERWVLAPPPRPDGSPGGLDQWMRYDYCVPGVLQLHFQNHAPGTAARFGFGEPDAIPMHASFTSQAVTPVTDDTSLYLFSWGPRSCEVQMFPQGPADMFALASRAFEEDRRMLEAQQRSLERRPEPAPLVIKHDRGPMLMRAVFERLLREEAGSQPARAQRGAEEARVNEDRASEDRASQDRSPQTEIAVQ